MVVEIPKPWVSQIELTENCNRRCQMCGIRQLKRNTYRFMTVDLAEKISLDFASWLPKLRIEFAMQGEPLVNKHAPEIIQTFRQNYPSGQLLVTTNSDPLKGDFTDTDRETNPKVFRGRIVFERVKELFDAGVNTLLVNDYDCNEQLLSDLKSIASTIGVGYFDYHEHKISPWSYRGVNHKEIVTMRWMQHLDEGDARRSLNNQAGNAIDKIIEHYRPLRQVPMHARCQLPFRELEIKYDGAVTSCCMQWGRDMIIGFFPQQSLKEIWESPKFVAVRKLLYEGERRLLKPCDGCDYIGFKTGLLKDPMPNTILSLDEIAKVANSLRLPPLPISNT